MAQLSWPDHMTARHTQGEGLGPRPSTWGPQQTGRAPRACLAVLYLCLFLRGQHGVEWQHVQGQGGVQPLACRKRHRHPWDKTPGQEPPSSCSPQQLGGGDCPTRVHGDGHQPTASCSPWCAGSWPAGAVAASRAPGWT